MPPSSCRLDGILFFFDWSKVGAGSAFTVHARRCPMWDHTDHSWHRKLIISRTEPLLSLRVPHRYPLQHHPAPPLRPPPQQVAPARHQPDDTREIHAPPRVRERECS